MLAETEAEAATDGAPAGARGLGYASVWCLAEAVVLLALLFLMAVAFRPDDLAWTLTLLLGLPGALLCLSGVTWLAATGRWWALGATSLIGVGALAVALGAIGACLLPFHVAPYGVDLHATLDTATPFALVGMVLVPSVPVVVASCRRLAALGDERSSCRQGRYARIGAAAVVPVLALATSVVAVTWAPGAAGARTWSSSDGGISVRYPPGFDAEYETTVNGLGRVAWFDDDTGADRLRHELQVGVVDLATAATLDDFAAQAAFVAEGESLAPTGQAGTLTLDGVPARSMTYTTHAQALGNFLNLSWCEDERFCLAHEGGGVHVVRLIAVHDGRGYSVTLFAAPGNETADDALLAAFASTIRFS